LNITVSIVEDDPGVRAILADWIERADGFRLAGEFSNVESALANIPRNRPDVVLVDINLSGQSGITCVRQLKPVMPETQFVMVTVFEDGDHIFDALTAGASGYLLKRTPREDLLAAIEQVHAGGSPMSSYIARKVVQWFQKQQPEPRSEPEGLSAREREILRLLARGFAYKEMADSLGVSIGTINTHIRRIYQKLHVSSRGEAVALFAPFPSEPKAAGPGGSQVST
jgi:DNA-binding NarL/FixJ family response regulator